MGQINVDLGGLVRRPRGLLRDKKFHKSVRSKLMRSRKFRSSREGKYTVDPANNVVLAMLERLCRRDKDHPSDFINSVYFDTPDLLLLGQKVDSDYHKNKLRLRWYGMPTMSAGSTPAYLEVKQKTGAQRSKTRKQLDVPVKLLMPGKESLNELSALADHVGDLGWFPSAALFPMIVIRYFRHRFTEPASGARIALDSRIQYTRVNSIFFPETPPRMLRHGVLEIKSDTGGIPPQLLPIKSRVNTRDSFSKYEECWNMYASSTYRRELTSSRYD